MGGFELLPVAGLDEPLPIGPRRVDIAVNLHGRGPLSNSRVAELGARVAMAHGTATGGPVWRESTHQRERWTRLLEWQGIEADPLDVGLSMPPGPHIVLERPELRRRDPFASDPDPALLGVSVGDVLDAVGRLELPASGSSSRR